MELTDSEKKIIADHRNLLKENQHGKIEVIHYGNKSFDTIVSRRSRHKEDQARRVERGVDRLSGSVNK